MIKATFIQRLVRAGGSSFTDRWQQQIYTRRSSVERGAHGLLL